MLFRCHEGTRIGQETAQDGLVTCAVARQPGVAIKRELCDRRETFS